MEPDIKSSTKDQQFRQWVQDYSDMLYRYCLKHAMDEDLAKDLVQETFLAAWRNLERYRGEASVKNWLFTILKNKISDYYRKSSTKFEVELVHREHKEPPFFDEEDHWRKGSYPQNWTVDYSNPVEIKEFYAVFQSCGSKLKELQSAVFFMKYVDGLKSGDICRKMNITTSNYWVLLHRAKVQLRACLEKNWGHK